MNPEPDDQQSFNRLMLSQHSGGNRDDNKNYKDVPAEADPDRGLKVGFSKFAGVIFDALTAAITALQTALVTILTTIASNISSAATTVSTAISNLSSALVTAINNFSTALTTALGLISTALGTINTTIGGITTALAGIATIATESTALRKQGQNDFIAAGAFAGGAVADLSSALAGNYNNCRAIITNGDTTAPQVATVVHLAGGGATAAYHLGDATGGTALGYPLQPGESRVINIGRMKTSDKLRGCASSTAVKWALYGAAE